MCVSLGGDSGNGSNHFDMLRLMYLAATVYKDARNDVGVMPAERVLEMATIRGAEALRLERADRLDRAGQARRPRALRPRRARVAAAARTR